MIKNIFLGVMILAVSIFAWNITLNNQTSAENPFQRVCDSTDPKVRDSTVCRTSSDVDPINDSDGIVSTIANLIAAIGGLIAVIMIIYNGLQLIMSSGDSSKVSQARTALIYTAVGVVVLVLARTIVYFIVGNL